MTSGVFGAACVTVAVVALVLAAAGADDAKPAAPTGRPYAWVAPMVVVSDIAVANAYYREALGFDIEFTSDAFTALSSGGPGACSIHLGLGEPVQHGGHVKIGTSDVDALHADLQARGAEIVGGVVDQPWGDREFVVLDPDGNRLVFCEGGGASK